MLCTCLFKILSEPLVPIIAIFATTFLFKNLAYLVVFYCRRRKKLRAMLAMSVCFAANIGGTGTTIGTGPNLVLLGNLDDKFKGHPLSFGTWMAFAVPIEIVCLLLLWLWLQFYYLPWPFSRDAQRHKKPVRCNRETQNQSCKFSYCH